MTGVQTCALPIFRDQDNDVIVLITDAEEQGTLGASGFISEDEWARDIGLALNFDARGNSGPSIMFETSDGNGWLIRKYAQAAQQPLATSLSMDIYKIMPNTSDLSVFKRARMGGLNFAYDGLSLPMAQPVMFLVVLFTGALMPLWGPIFAMEPKPVRLKKWRRSAALQMEAEHTS